MTKIPEDIKAAAADVIKRLDSLFDPAQSIARAILAERLRSQAEIERLSKEVKFLKAQLAFSDAHARKIEDMLEPHILWTPIGDTN